MSTAIEQYEFTEGVAIDPPPGNGNPGWPGYPDLDADIWDYEVADAMSAEPTGQVGSGNFPIFDMITTP